MRFRLWRPGCLLVALSVLAYTSFQLHYSVSVEGRDTKHPICDLQKPENGTRSNQLREAQSVYDLQGVVNEWGKNPAYRDLYTKFSAIYRLSSVVSNITVKDPFLNRVKSWLPGLSEDIIQQQTIISILNRYTFEHSIINLIRSRRPGITDGEDIDSYVANLVRESSHDCDFCQYSTNTAENSFGRIESKFSVTAANVFPFDGYHGVIIFKKHHPLQFSLEEFLDAMEVTRQWMRRGHAEDPAYRFPHLTWDCLPKGSTSQIHSHAQVTLNSVSHYGQLELLKAAASRFEGDFPGEDYLEVLEEIHKKLNLTICHGDAQALALLTPKKDDDLFITAPQPSKHFYRLLHSVLRAYIDDMRIYAWSMAMFFPTLDASGNWGEGPVIARIISRGPATIMRSDISALELFAASNVNRDPFVLIKRVGESLEKSGIATECKGKQGKWMSAF